MSIRPFKDQDYNELIGNYSSDNLFEDPEFEASDYSLYYSKSPPAGIIWCRPNEVFDSPEFISDGINRTDMNQGAIGNCWFIAGVVGIMQSPKLLRKVVPQDQSFGDNYTGMFHFRFWLHGDWVDVVIDDRLPVYESTGKLVFASNTERPQEMWAPLLEKAYAKLYGNYENLEAGLTTDALIDMSAGLKEDFSIKKMTDDEREGLWRILFQAFHKNSIMGCSIHADPRVREARLANGLVRGHAYTITKLAVLSSCGDARILRMRNPWGGSVEWKGEWSDSSRAWDSVSDEEKEECGYDQEADGEFWMSFEDFLANWHSVEICHLSAESFSEEIEEADDFSTFSWRKLASDGENWKCTNHHSSWVTGSTAGGCGNGNLAKFWQNPQFIVSVCDVDADDCENSSTMIIALMQKDARLKRMEAAGTDQAESIQFRLYKISDDVDLEDTKSTSIRLYANQLNRIGSSGSYINSREVTKRFKVEPGNYVIIPSTFEDDRDCDFLLRIFTEKDIEANSLEEHKEELDEEESYFDLEDVDEEFSSWDNFLDCDDENFDEDYDDDTANYDYLDSQLDEGSSNSKCHQM